MSERYSGALPPLLARHDCTGSACWSAGDHCRARQQSAGAVKYLDGIADDEIVGLNIPTGIPSGVRTRRQSPADRQLLYRRPSSDRQSHPGGCWSITSTGVTQKQTEGVLSGTARTSQESARVRSPRHSHCQYHSPTDLSGRSSPKVLPPRKTWKDPPRISQSRSREKRSARRHVRRRLILFSIYHSGRANRNRRGSNEKITAEKSQA